ncbi:winged helix-turn-helix domain-containing protein [Ferrimonas sp. YFM]|uniref:winged helix-turn-helix domain-containing protein n=1 Tax=Ferrimonas sp. YFM TaxID=3028878 RepID=UPI002574600A|nr:winged helix-turn-helix domain-containing protein [Ferrimonas sp. YFM]
MQWIIGEFLYLSSGRRLRGPSGRWQQLSPKAAQVLEVFLAHPGELLSYSALMKLAWGGRVVTECAVRRAVTEIRKGFGDDFRAPRYLETRQSQGYRWLKAPLSAQIEGGQAPRESVLLPGIAGLTFAALLLWAWQGEMEESVLAPASEPREWPRFAETGGATWPPAVCQPTARVTQPPLRY